MQAKKNYHLQYHKQN